MTKTFTGAAMFYPINSSRFPPTMVNGERYNPNDFTCAMDVDGFKIGDVVRVSYETSRGYVRSVRCRITDSPWNTAVDVGLSWRAYRTLESPDIRPLKVTVEHA